MDGLYSRVVMPSLWVWPRKTWEKWHLLTVETEAKWGLKEYIWKGSFHGWFVRLVVTLFLSCHGWSCQPSTKYFTSLVPIAQQAGQAVVLRHPVSRYLSLVWPPYIPLSIYCWLVFKCLMTTSTLPSTSTFTSWTGSFSLLKYITNPLPNLYIRDFSLLTHSFVFYGVSSG